MEKSWKLSEFEHESPFLIAYCANCDKKGEYNSRMKFKKKVYVNDHYHVNRHLVCPRCGNETILQCPN